MNHPAFLLAALLVIWLQSCSADPVNLNSGGTGGMRTDGGTGTVGGMIAKGGTTSGGGNVKSGGSTATGGKLATGGTMVRDAAPAVCHEDAATGGVWNPCPPCSDCKILPLGDSITDGSFAKLPGAYRVSLYELALAAGQHITFVGSQVSGPTTVTGGVPFPRRHEGYLAYTIDQVASRVPTPALREIPHIVLLLAGSTDVVSNQATMPTAPQRMTKLIQKLVTEVPDALIVVATLPPMTNKNADLMPLIHAFNAALPGVVDGFASQGKHVILVDMSVLLNWEIEYSGFHPSKNGYPRVAKIWYEAISKYLH
jgi:lysophospholipase L1-like esterase